MLKMLHLSIGRKARRERGRKIRWVGYKANIKKVELNPSIPIIILNTNGLSPSNKKQRCSI